MIISSPLCSISLPDTFNWTNDKSVHVLILSFKKNQPVLKNVPNFLSTIVIDSYRK